MKIFLLFFLLSGCSHLSEVQKVPNDDEPVYKESKACQSARQNCYENGLQWQQCDSEYEKCVDIGEAK